MSTSVRYSSVCRRLLISGRRSCSQGAAGPADGDRVVSYSLPMNGAVELCGLPLIRQKKANEWGTVRLRFIQGATRRSKSGCSG
jgi:hypothetical protein